MLEEEGKEADVILKEMEAAKWEEKWDVWQDRVYFQHIDTGEIVNDEKSIRDYIPR